VSQIEYRLFAPRNREEMIDLQSRAYVMPRSQADCFYDEGEVESLGAFDGSYLASALDIIHFRIRLWDREVEAGGIASVATHVEYRGRGLASRLMGVSLERLKERGIPVSTLYPFSRAFYRRLGWEHAGDLLHLTIPFADLKRLSRGGESPLSRGGEGPQTRFIRLEVDAQGLLDMTIPSLVYDVATRPYNCPNVRCHEWGALARRTKKDMDGGSPRYAYAGLRGGFPESYAIYSIGSGGESASIRLMDVAAIHAGAWRDLLEFLSMHVTDAGKLDLYLPVDSPVRLLLPEANKGTIQPSLMLRVVDVEKALNILGRPSSSPVDRLLLRIQDPICPWNNGVFEIPIEARPHGTLVQGTQMIGDDRTEPELATDIATFSQIASGYVTPVRAAGLGRLDVLDARGLDKLTRVFPGRTTFTADFY